MGDRSEDGAFRGRKERVAIRKSSAGRDRAVSGAPKRWPSGDSMRLVAQKDGAKLTVGEWESLAITERSFGSRLSVHVRPRSARRAILGVREGALDVALTAPPAEGAANSELFVLLAKALDVRRGDLSIAVGMSSRNKVIDVNGVKPEDARERLQKARR